MVAMCRFTSQGSSLTGARRRGKFLFLPNNCRFVWVVCPCAYAGLHKSRYLWTFWTGIWCLLLLQNQGRKCASPGVAFCSPVQASPILYYRIYRARSLQRVKSPDQTDTEQNPNFIVDPLRDQKTSVAVTNWSDLKISPVDSLGWKTQDVMLGSYFERDL